MAANTNVPLVTRTEGVPMHFFECTTEQTIGDTELASPVALFRCDLDTAFDVIHVGYGTESTSGFIKISYATDLAGTTRTDIATGIDVNSTTKERDASLSNAAFVPAGSWVFVEVDSGTITNLDGLRIHFRGRKNVRG